MFHFSPSLWTVTLAVPLIDLPTLVPPGAVRLSTGMQRGAALSDPTAGIMLCLVSGNGTALLHRVPRVNDPEITEQEASSQLALKGCSVHRQFTS